MNTLPDEFYNPIVIPVSFIPERLAHAIQTMEGVVSKGYKLNLEQWYTFTPDNYHSVRDGVTSEELHKCGTAACLVGWIATTPEWREAGGAINYGVPTLNDMSSDLVKSWFGEDVPPLIHNVYSVGRDTSDTTRFEVEACKQIKEYDASFVEYSVYATPEHIEMAKQSGELPDIQATPNQVLEVLRRIRDEGVIVVQPLSIIKYDDSYNDCSEV